MSGDGNSPGTGAPDFRMKVDTEPFRYRNASSSWVALPVDTALTTGVWYDVEFYDYVWGGTDTCKVKINGVYKGTLELATTNGSYVNQIHIYKNAGTSSMYIDDVYVYDDSSSSSSLSSSSSSSSISYSSSSSSVGAEGFGAPEMDDYDYE